MLGGSFAASFLVPEIEQSFVFECPFFLEDFSLSTVMILNPQTPIASIEGYLPVDFLLMIERINISVARSMTRPPGC